MQTQIHEDRFAKLDKIMLGHGSHPTPDAGMCALEAVAWLAGEPHSDHPKCVSPVIAAFGRQWNDDLDDERRQKLKPYLAKMIGTRSTAEIESQRGWMCTDWLVRHHTPAWLDLAGCTEQAAALRALPEITGTKSCTAAQATIDGARKHAAAAGAAAWSAAREAAWGEAAWSAAWDAAGEAAWSAARDAAGAAAWSAARYAAWSAPRAAAGDAAWSAAREAAWDAAWSAARDAAWDAPRAAAGDAPRAAARAAARKKLEPTRVSLQTSAFDLLDRMIALKPEAERNAR